MTALADAVRLLVVEKPASGPGLPLRYVDHWGTGSTVYQRRVESDPNPMPVFQLPLVRLWRWRW